MVCHIFFMTVLISFTSALEYHNLNIGTAPVKRQNILYQSNPPSRSLLTRSFPHDTTTTLNRRGNCVGRCWPSSPSRRRPNTPKGRSTVGNSPLRSGHSPAGPSQTGKQKSDSEPQLSSPSSSKGGDPADGSPKAHRNRRLAVGTLSASNIADSKALQDSSGSTRAMTRPSPGAFPGYVRMVRTSAHQENLERLPSFKDWQTKGTSKEDVAALLRPERSTSPDQIRRAFSFEPRPASTSTEGMVPRLGSEPKLYGRQQLFDWPSTPNKAQIDSLRLPINPFKPSSPRKSSSGAES